MEVTSIDILNDDCLKAIFSFLAVGERLITEGVCKRWQRISAEGWPNIKCLHSEQLDVTKNGTKTIIRRCGQFLEELSIVLLTSWKHMALLRMISDHCHQLKIIAIQFGNCPNTDALRYYDEHLPEIFSKLQQLHTVKIGSYSQLGVQDKHLSTLSVENLQRLAIYEGNDNGRLVTVNLSRFINLRWLEFGNMILTPQSTTHFKELPHLPMIRSISFRNSAEFFSRIFGLKCLESSAIDENNDVIHIIKV